MLGLQDSLVGITHECDFPEDAKRKPVLVDCALDLSRLSSKEIDRAVAERIGSGQSLYRVHERRLIEARPDLIVTQNLCQVCGPAGNEVSQVLRAMNPAPKILWQTPKSFQEVFDCLLELGRETGTEAEARDIVRKSLERVEIVKARCATGAKPVRVSFLEWVDPLYCGGHWIPEMLEWVGAYDVNSRKNVDSVRIQWASVKDFQPEVVVVSPCGYRLKESLALARSLEGLEGWRDIPAVRSRRVFAVDANAYFARPGPRLVEGLEILAQLIKPEANLGRPRLEGFSAL